MSGANASPTGRSHLVMSDPLCSFLSPLDQANGIQSKTGLAEVFIDFAALLQEQLDFFDSDTPVYFLQLLQPFDLVSQLIGHLSARMRDDGRNLPFRHFKG